MPTEKWVDSVTGNNANAGTQAAPYQTLYYAVDQNRNPADNLLIVNVVPTNPLLSTDSIRITQLHNTEATFLVRSATPGVNWSCSNGTNAEFILLFNSSKGKLQIQEATVTCRRIVNGDPNVDRSAQIEIAGSCAFTHSRNNIEAAFRYASGSGTYNLGALRIAAGCTITGWQNVFDMALGASGSGLGEFDLNGVTITSGSDANIGTNTVSSPITRLRNCSLTFSNSTVANRLLFRTDVTTELTIENNTISNSANSGLAVYLEPPQFASGNLLCAVKFNNNSITLTHGAAVQIGRDLVDSSSRAANDALVRPFASVEAKNNDITQTLLGGSLFNVHTGANNAVVENNYFRVGTLGNTTNVHQVYLHADGVKFRNNYLAASVLAFGTNQAITGNVIVADRCILLGGTQGGSLAIKGGNFYTIRNNILVAVEDDCIADYAWGGAYPTNIGVLEADINSNRYVVLSDLGADGLARLTNGNSGNGWTATTLAQLQNLWQQSVLTGTGTGVWGAASNAGNDNFSKLVDGQDLDFLKNLCTAGNTLSLGSLKAIKKQFTASGSGGGGIIRPIVR
jgi:hypothetical protein